MPVSYKASPKLRDARPRPDTTQPAKAKFVLQDRAQAASPSGGATRILRVAFVLLLMGLGAHAMWSKMQGPDPHYLKAKKLVLDYEYGKPMSARNYGHATYRQALAELALVHPQSRSAEPARAMKMELEQNIATFRKQQKKIGEQLSSARVKIRERRELEVEARMQSLMSPKTEMPECELEEGDDLYGGHAH